MATQIQVVFHSLYGHVYTLAQAVVEGAREIEGVEVELFRVRETLSDEILGKMHAVESVKAMADVPVAEARHLADADAVILGSPTRYGSNTAQMQTFLDSTVSLFSSGALINTVGSAFTSSASQHGGQETTLMSMFTFFIHQGMMVVGVPYSNDELRVVDEVSGGTPYGASAIAGPTGQRGVTDNERAIAVAQGRHVAEVARWLKKGRGAA